MSVNHKILIKKEYVFAVKEFINISRADPAGNVNIAAITTIEIAHIIHSTLSNRIFTLHRDVGMKRNDWIASYVFNALIGLL